MKSKLKSSIKLILPQSVLDYLKYDFNNHELKRLLYSNIKINQKILFNQFQKTPSSLFKECGFRVHSDSEEDGLLLFIFSKVGFTKRRIVKSFFSRHPNTKLIPPTIANEWLTKDNINELLSKYGYTGEIDILLLDIDGNDYNLMKSINVISPRVVIFEINNVIPSNLSITMPYESDFYRSFNHPLSDYIEVYHY